MSNFPEPYTLTKKITKVELESSNYATTPGLKSAKDVST